MNRIKMSTNALMETDKGKKEVISEDLSCPACHKHYRNKAFPCLKDHAVCSNLLPWISEAVPSPPVEDKA